MKEQKKYITHLISGLLGMPLFIVVSLLKNEIVYMYIAAVFGLSIIIMDTLYERIKMEMDLKWQKNQN